ncbi:MAG: tetratricopeptide repeat protein, partial [Candidatus Nanoarchaeia archaeon]
AIKQWEDYAKANPDKKEESEANISQLKSQRDSYILEKAVERVNAYPNDLQLRYELALAYWEKGDVDNALQQFQLSQKNPQRRLSSLVYLGRCFSEKGQYDLAVEQFTKAIDEMLAMDNQKMDALYHLGLTYEKLGKTAEALDSFKKIYQANVKFRDVAERINKAYAKK